MVLFISYLTLIFLLRATISLKIVRNTLIPPLINCTKLILIILKTLSIDLKKGTFNFYSTRRIINYKGKLEIIPLNIVTLRKNI